MIPKWFVGLVILWISAITAVSGWGYQRQEETNAELAAQNAVLEAETAARQESLCVSADEARAQLRDIAKQSGITSGVIGGEALITAITQTGGTPDEAAVDAYRQALTRLLAPALDDIVNQLPGRRWHADTQSCVDVELDQ